MIDYNPKIWFRHARHFHRSDTLRKLWPELLLVAAYSGLMTWLEKDVFSKDDTLFKLSAQTHAYLGFAFSLLLVFRINSAYERWWEGRKLWGKLVNDCRSLSIRVKALLPGLSAEDGRALTRLIQAYPVACKEHLRKGVETSLLILDEADRVEIENKEHVPNAIVVRILSRVVAHQRAHNLPPETILAIDPEIKGLTDVIGGCERIKNTPIPFSYGLFLKKFILLYVVMAPLAYIPSLGYWCVPVSMLVFYFFVSLELISEEIEDPFGTDANDLPTDKLTETIGRNVEELGVK